MFIASLGTAVPATRYTQQQCWEAFHSSRQFQALGKPAQALLRRILLGDSGIETRHLALDDMEDAFTLSPDVLNRRFEKHAPRLATQAGACALERAGIEAKDIDALLVSTCTGYLCPGLTSYVSERLGLREDILGLDLVGQGCGAALPNLRTAEALLASGRCESVLSVCVEVCSAALYIDDDPGVLVSACLFGDGAAAAVLSRDASARSRRLEWRSAYSLSNPLERDALRLESRGGMLRNILSRDVPKVAARHAKQLLTRALDEQELHSDDIAAWIWHAGGRSVLDRLRESIALDEAQVRYSRDVLRRYGNLSSPFVFFVLEAALAEHAPAGRWWMSSFGAGFACHGALLEAA